MPFNFGYGISSKIIWLVVTVVNALGQLCVIVNVARKQLPGSTSRSGIILLLV